jgi:hypothetical protein
MGAFGYSAFRRRAVTVVSIAAVAVVVFCAFFYAFFRLEQINLFRSKAEEINNAVERAIKREEDRLTTRLNGVYASEPLLEDLARLFSAQTEEEYIAARRDASESDARALRSFPEFMRAYAGDGGALVRIAAGGNAASFGKGGTAYEFAAADNGGYCVAIERVIYNPFRNYEMLGAVSFYYDIELLTRNIVDYAGVTQVAAVGREFFFLKGQDSRELGQIAAEGAARFGTIWSYPNSIHYSAFDSINYGYRLIATTNDAAFIRENGGALAARFAVVFALCALFVLVFLLNARYDAIFLQRIFTSIDAIKRGEFPNDDESNGQARRANEYGNIAKEINDMSRRLHRYIQVEYELKIKQREAEMKALQRQISPHFLYNTLEIIRGGAIEGGDPKTADAIWALSAFYRDVVKTAETCTISDELRLLEKYLKIMEFRSSGRFLYQISIAKELHSVKTVKLWMQPMAENFFAHGFNPENEFNTLVVSGEAVQGGAVFSITDNGPVIPAERIDAINAGLADGKASGGVGMSNVYSRLRLFYGDGLTMRVSGNAEGGAKIAVFIPVNIPAV